MKIFLETKKLVIKEKEYTIKILQNLMIIEKDKLFTKLKYPSLHKYLIMELGYTDAEAVIRVHATRLMLKSKTAKIKIEKGSLSLSNAFRAHQVIQQTSTKDKEKIEKVINKAAQSSKREFNKYIEENFIQTRREVIVLDERVLIKLDRFKKKINVSNNSSYELINILLERELKNITQVSQFRNSKINKSRFIAKAIKAQVNSGECANCKKMWDLEYDHIIKFSHGGKNNPENLQMLCRACNQAKEIEARKTKVFA